MCQGKLWPAKYGQKCLQAQTIARCSRCLGAHFLSRVFVPLKSHMREYRSQSYIWGIHGENKLMFEVHGCREGWEVRWVWSSLKAWVALVGKNGGFHLASFLVSLVKGLAMAEKWGMVQQKKLHRPRNCLISVTDFGSGHLFMTSVLRVPGQIPCWWEMLHPR